MKKTGIKVLGLTFAAVMLVTATIFSTMAYLTSQDTVTNTFTVGKVSISLDEAKVDEDGQAIENEPRVKENNYKLLPGHEYDKDPTVTVEAGSEDSYVRMLLTINEQADLDALFANQEEAGDLSAVLTGFDESKWQIVNSNPPIVDDSRTYEFRYIGTENGIVSAAATDTVLPALFTGIKMPSWIDGNGLAAIADLKITVGAHAIQADGFESADAAWAVFDAE